MTVLAGRSEVGGLAEQLSARRPEIEQAVVARMWAVSDSGDTDDPEYAAALRGAVTVAVQFGITSIEQAAEVPIPLELMAQARYAARRAVPLETVMRRYAAGHALLFDFVIQEAARTRSSDGAELKRAVQAQAALFDRLLTMVASEYRSEVKSLQPRNLDQRLLERTRKLLAGEVVSATELNYPMMGWHLAVIARGGEAEGLASELSRVGDFHVLSFSAAEETIWAWLGSRRPSDPIALASSLQARVPEGTWVAFGEPAAGLPGWRLSHRQAAAALTVASPGVERVIRYADVAVAASAMQDETLARSLRNLFLAPLASRRDGDALRLTLRAYFGADRNVSSAAVALDVSRQTVMRRLRQVEEAIDRPLSSCALEVEVALRMGDVPGFQ